jgi:hypothetical protein
MRKINSKRIKWALNEARIGKRPLGRPKGRWVHNIKIYFREIVWEVVDWMHLAQDSD